ncbi:LLM class flavin-dependent oxidoreductase [Actinomadura sp. DSM 109109]|nr:LLM class flavin-dependent oxidoreductase [Actinomadura lepetitiana]
MDDPVDGGGTGDLLRHLALPAVAVSLIPMGTPYRAFHDWLGHGDGLSESRALYDPGDGAAAGPALPDDIVDALWIHGSLDECRRQIARFVQPGVTSGLLFVAPTPELLTAATHCRTSCPACVRKTDSPATGPCPQFSVRAGAGSRQARATRRAWVRGRRRR